MLEFEIDPEWIERIGRVDPGGVEERRTAAPGTDPERQRSGLVLRLALVPQALDREIEVVRKLIFEVGEQAVPLERDLHVIERREVERVGSKVRVTVAEVRDRRRARRRIDQRFVVGAREDRADEAAVRKEARAAGDVVAPAIKDLAGIGIGVREGGDRPVARAHRALLHIIATDHERQPVGVAVAPAHLDIIGLAVALLILAVLRRSRPALLVRLGDDVHDAGDCVRTVDRRRAVLQDFDALDHAFRNGVEVDRGRNAAGRGAGNVAQAIDQHEGPARAQVAQVDFRRSGADAAAVRRVAEVARIVELRVGAAARARQALEHVVDRAQTGLGDVLLVKEHARRVEVERVAADARPGDDDVALGRGGCRAGRGLAGVRRRQRALGVGCARAADQRCKSHARAKCRVGPDHVCSPLVAPAETGMEQP